MTKNITRELKILLPSNTAPESIEETLRQQGVDNVSIAVEGGQISVSIYDLPVQDLEAWQGYFQRIYEAVSEIVEYDASVWQSAWQEEASASSAITTTQSFGSPDHAATKSLMELMDQMLLDPEPHQRIVDIGCGSGILCIKASELGFTDIWGTESDEAAFLEAKQNLDANQVSAHIFQQSHMPEGLFHVVLCNVQPPALNQLMASLITIAHRDGLILLSGFNQANEKNVVLEMQSLGYHKVQELEVRGWLAMAFKAEGIEPS